MTKSKDNVMENFTDSADNHGGFSLIEIAIVLVIIGLILGGLLAPLSTQQEISDIKETQQILDETLAALYGYAYSNGGTLPCPDTDGDGLEDSAANCPGREGDVPWATLGTPSGDSFRGNRLGYRIDATLTNHATIFCDSSNPATMNICTDNTCGTTLTGAAALVIWSHGKNGFGATNAQGGTNVAPVSLDENVNIHTANDALAANDNFVKRTRTDASSAAGEFDDMVEYVTDVRLCARMVEAGIIAP